MKNLIKNKSQIGNLRYSKIRHRETSKEVVINFKGDGNGLSSFNGKISDFSITRVPYMTKNYIKR